MVRGVALLWVCGWYGVVMGWWMGMEDVRGEGRLFYGMGRVRA